MPQQQKLLRTKDEKMDAVQSEESHTSTNVAYSKKKK